METSTFEPTVAFSLTVKNGDVALAFYQHAFGAQEIFRLPAPDGGVAHAEFLIGNTKIFLSEDCPDWHAASMPENLLSSCLFSIVCEDCDASYAQATKAGAKELSPPQDQFWGMRTAVVADPYGYRWSFGQRVEVLSPEEVMQRAKDLFSGA
jgi:PhnB protein